jgi:hypothetical protein
MQYSVLVLGATGNVGGRIVQLLIKNPLCKKLVVVTRRTTDIFAAPKVFDVVVNMDRLEEEVAPYAHGIVVALARSASARAARRCQRKRCARSKSRTPRPCAKPLEAGGARVCGVMTAAGANPESGMKYAKIIGEKKKAVESVKFDFLGIYRPAVILGNANTPSVLNYLMPLLHWAMPSKYHSIQERPRAGWWRSRSRRSSRWLRETVPRAQPRRSWSRRTWSPSSSRARATSLEQQQTARVGLKYFGVCLPEER